MRRRQAGPSHLFPMFERLAHENNLARSFPANRFAALSAAK
jgi:hypothetical protein